MPKLQFLHIHFCFFSQTENQSFIQFFACARKLGSKNIEGGGVKKSQFHPEDAPVNHRFRLKTGSSCSAIPAGSYCRDEMEAELFINGGDLVGYEMLSLRLPPTLSFALLKGFGLSGSVLLFHSSLRWFYNQDICGHKFHRGAH